MDSNILYRNLHTGPRQGKEQESIVSHWAGPIPCTRPGPIPVQCEQAIALKRMTFSVVFWTSKHDSKIKHAKCWGALISLH